MATIPIDAMTNRHPLTKPRKRGAVSTQDIVVSVQPSVESSGHTQTGPLVACDDSILCAPSEVRPQSFLESLHLSPQQMASFLNDAGSFLYMTYAQHGQGSRSAYELVLVEHSQVDPDDYFTLSCSGVTHFTGYDSDFTPLRQWEREFTLFNSMRCIPCFARYRAWKTFIVWKKNVKRSKIKSSVTTLRASLFIFVPSLRDGLVKIQTLCYGALSMKLVETEPGKTYELAEFRRAQEKLQDDRAKSLVLFTSDAQRIARIACDEVVDAFLHDAKIVADHRMTFMERASLRSECRKLTRFLRLVDFHVVTTLRELALESVRVAYELTAPVSLPPRIVLCDEPAGNEYSALSAAGFTGPSDFDDESDLPQLVPLLRVEVSCSNGELERVISVRSFFCCAQLFLCLFCA